ncbi:hypothetical protein GOP47_0012414 [Adiantum capillus-veneris]|uniref:Uncharacterized protein n=1 Tax=Adiantum capillus-veneris TaxID=13818 RepID=A0A9D4ZEA4_ADICA|nr:hypothetical protein GOP47_0012414 [Adiantum capillus-veneris]
MDSSMQVLRIDGWRHALIMKLISVHYMHAWGNLPSITHRDHRAAQVLRRPVEYKYKHDSTKGMLEVLKGNQTITNLMETLSLWVRLHQKYARNRAITFESVVFKGVFDKNAGTPLYIPPQFRNGYAII